MESSLRMKEMEYDRSGLAVIARHVIQRTSNPRLLSKGTPHDVASDICLALMTGG